MENGIQIQKKPCNHVFNLYKDATTGLKILVCIKCHEKEKAWKQGKNACRVGKIDGHTKW